MILATVAVSCAISARSFAVDVSKFVMAPTVSWWWYLLSRFAVTFCATL